MHCFAISHNILDFLGVNANRRDLVPHKILILILILQIIFIYQPFKIKRVDCGGRSAKCCFAMI